MPAYTHNCRPAPWSLAAGLFMVTAAPLISEPAAATTLTVVHSFGGLDGSTPDGTLVLGSDGDLFGTTESGGAFNLGTVFKCTVAGQLTTLHSFNGFDGQSPSTGVVEGSDGDLYGVAAEESDSSTYGHIFKVSPSGVFTDLHDFSKADGEYPQGPLLLYNGDFYGVTAYGGANGAGTFFKITTDGTFTVLVSIPSHAYNSSAGLTDAGDGTFVGVTNVDEDYAGVVDSFSASGTWNGGSVFPLHSKYGSDFVSPVMVAGDYQYVVVTGSGGHVLADTYPASGTWSTLHTFVSDGTNEYPIGNLVRDASGIIWGVTSSGGTNGDGTVFGLLSDGSFETKWSFTGADGNNPESGLLMTAGDVYYGVAETGGADNDGAIYKFVPAFDAPGSLTSLSTDGPVGLSWDYDLPATSFNLYRGTSPGGESANPYAIDVAATTYTDTDVAVGTHYYYTVKGVDSAGTSPASVETNVIANAPPTVTVIAHNGEVTVSWTSVPGATSYVLTRNVPPQSAETSVMVTGLTYTDTNVTNGTSYRYEVATMDATGTSVSNWSQFVTPNAPTGAPYDVGAQAGDGEVTLSWNPYSGWVSFDVYRGTSSGGEGTTPLATGVTSTTYTDTSVIAGTTYYYYLTAIDAGGPSPDSTEVGATPYGPPPVPSGVTASAGFESALVRWQASADASTYNVYRGTTSGGEGSIPLASGAARSFTDDNLTAGETYYYTVASVDSNGTSAQSNQAEATPYAAPSRPTNLSATGSSGKVDLSWTAGAYDQTYRIYRGTTANTLAEVKQGVTDTTYTDTGLTNGTTYFYRVAGVNPVGSSGGSNLASATP